MYRGPKAFQRHFAEWRHAHGMRCLGIPNTAHFANVTLIEDAIACKYYTAIFKQLYMLSWRNSDICTSLAVISQFLFSVWQKIKTNKESDRWKADMEEEYEDSSGNVVNKKTFEDLKRQGLL